MKKHVLSLLVIFVFLYPASKAQFTKYIVQFKDKAGTPFTINNSSQFLSSRAIQRRARQKIAVDSTDLPITPKYLDSIQLAGNVIILNKSKWLNQVCIQTNDAAALARINNFPFVISSNPVRRTMQGNRENFITQNKFNEEITQTNAVQNLESTSDFFNYGNSYKQIHIHQGEFLHNHGFRGDGMLMSIMDAGFNNYLSVTAFDTARNNNQIVETYDYVNNETSVNEDDAHGMFCFSIIAGNLPGKFIGSCPKAKYYLYRTEDAPTEYPVEEQNWVAAAERADSIGIDVFSTSLGYTTFDNPIFNHTYADMNGKTTIIARGNALAAKKGIISVVAAGNDGTSSWHYISTPADADSIVTVGAVNTSGAIASFSSYGPSSDGRVKPTVASVGLGTALINTNSQPVTGNGTSFATPNMAGLITCLWQAFPEVTNLQIIDALKQSSNRFLTPDDRTGYGIPDMKKAFVYLLKQLYSQKITVGSCDLKIDLGLKYDSVMPFIIERKLPLDSAYKTVNTTASGGYSFKNFIFTDDLTNISPGIIHYRIKQSIGTDTTFFLDSLSVNFTQHCVSETKISINPNPVKDVLHAEISLVSPARVTVVIHNFSGQKLYSIAYNQTQGRQLYTIPFGKMPGGWYSVSVFLDTKKEVTKKILKL